MTAIQIPREVTDWIAEVFEGCNIRITQKLSNIPNIPEESLDLTWIEHFSHFSSPVTLTSGWSVKIETQSLLSKGNGLIRRAARLDSPTVGAAELFEATTGGANLHQLRHSALTHAAEDGANTATLLAFSGHTSVQTWQGMRACRLKLLSLPF